MSRIGKQPIQIPGNVKVAVDGHAVKVTGPLGSLDFYVRPEIQVAVKGPVIEVTRNDETRTAMALHGLTRSLIANMVKGVTVGFEKKLDIIGVGYKADVQGSVINFALGFSHPIAYNLPKGVLATVDKQTSIVVKGPDKQVIGQVAAEIRSLRPPEPYKGKGIKYSDEVVRRKAGKAGKAAGAK
ncbi:MAG: 50S ribosomal protein L6 [Deltaproteobacteria bacterium]|nr:50S ribosomal protein L6 [Deltaproteobacteria bacterium]